MAAKTTRWRSVARVQRTRRRAGAQMLRQTVDAIRAMRAGSTEPDAAAALTAIFERESATKTATAMATMPIRSRGSSGLPLMFRTPDDELLSANRQRR